MIDLKKVIVISPDIIDKKMAGPGIRYWNITRELSKYCEVILFTPNKCTLTGSFEIIQISKKKLIEQASRSDCIVLQGVTLWAHPYLKKLNKPIAVDLYDPFVLENLELDYHSSEKNALHKASLSVLLDQLSWGDYFFCASEKQKDFWIGMLTTLNRINPVEYSKSKTLDHLIGIVPFGLSGEKAVKTKQVMKGVYPGISKEDKVILWGGGIWNWLDPLTAIKAIDKLSKKRKDIKLFFMGTKHPNPDIVSMKMLNDTVELSNSLMLTNKYVFFNDWVDYHQRHNYLLESDIGLSLHFNHLETRFSFRTRMLDYIWCDLPVIGTSGDVMADLIKRYELGQIVPPEDSEELARVIEETLEKNRNRTKEAFTRVAENFTWEKATLDLIGFCLNPETSVGKREKIIFKGLTNTFFYKMVKLMSIIKKGDFKILFNKIRYRLLK